jgi:hypothetical protein
VDRTIIDMPRAIAQTVNDWVINPRGRSAGDGVSGSGQVVYGAEPRWEAVIDFHAHPDFGLRVWRAIQAKLRGRVNVLRVPVLDAFHAESTNIEALVTENISFSDGALFSDGSGFEQWPVMTALASLQAGASRIFLDAATVGNVLQAGMYFSVDDWLYVVTEVAVVGSLTRYTFEPPLRRDINTGDVINLRPAVLMAFVSDIEGRVTVRPNTLLTSSIALVEWTNRP